MTERPCIRCHHPVVLEDGHLVYCSHCGAPQIFLSEELQAEIAESSRSFEESERLAVEQAATPGTSEASSRGSRWNPISRVRGLNGSAPMQPWPVGVRAALASAGVALGLGLCSLVLPPVSLLLVLWVISAPVLTVGFFHRRFRAANTPDTAFAAQLGLLTGLLVACCCFITFTLSLVLTRFVFHDAGALDAQLAANFTQQRAMVLARFGSEAQPTLDLFALPEFRVGLLLSVIAISGSIYLLLSSLAAAIADALLRRRRSLPG